MLTSAKMTPRPLWSSVPWLLGHVDRHRREHVRVQAQVVGAGAGLVELRPHRRVLELERHAGVVLRQRAAGPRAAVGTRRVGRGRRRAVVVRRELRRRERRAERRRVPSKVRPPTLTMIGVMSVSIVTSTRRAGAGVGFGADHVVAVGDAVVRVERRAPPVRDRPRRRQHVGAARRHCQRLQRASSMSCGSLAAGAGELRAWID